MKRPQGITEAAPSLWRILRRFSPYIRKRRALIAGSFIALFAEIGARLLEPWPLKFVLDRVLGSRPSRGGWHIAIVDHLHANELLILAAIATVVFSGTRALADYLNTVGFALVGNRVLSEIRYDLYRRLQCLSLSFHSKARGGDLTIRIMSDVGVLTDVAVNAVLPLLGRVLVMIVMYLGARMVLRDELTAGDLVIFFTYLKNTFKPLKDFAKYSGRLARAAVAGERAINVLHHEPEVQDLPGALSANPFRGAITFREVSFWYEPERRALDGVSLEVDPAQQIALLGHSGSGKSTLGSLILRLYDPQI